MWNLNVSGTLNVFKLLLNPSLCLPHATVSNFSQIPLPLGKAFTADEKSNRADIRAVVLDKDNCFALPGENVVHASNKDVFEAMKSSYSPRSHRLLIVSNTAGTSTADPSGSDARNVEEATGVPVLKHSTKKPGCSAEIMTYFQNHPESGVTHPSQVCIVGDRLFTDIMMANMMGSYGLWVRDGVRRDSSLFARFERVLYGVLHKRGYQPPLPVSPFEC